jgi:4-diphosphocytidyl-2-C-methyl-D-erythritol kinase
MRALHDVPAPAKLNLFLHVVGKRPDGYHLLESLFVLIDWADTLHFERRDDGQIQRHDLRGGDLCGGDLPADDLCVRAARALQAASGCTHGVDIHLDKQLPSGAGMGGGSSDAASTLLALNQLWGLHWPRERLMPIGLKLGADVPFFLGGQPAFVQGIGELLTPLAVPARRFAVLKGPAGLETRAIFSSPLLAHSEKSAIVAGFPAQAKTLENLVDGFGRNDLQPAAVAISVEVFEAIRRLDASFGNARMTGSGAAVFARLSGAGDDGRDERSLATLLQELPAGWTGRICRSLDQHPLRSWVG